MPPVCMYVSGLKIPSCNVQPGFILPGCFFYYAEARGIRTAAYYRNTTLNYAGLLKSYFFNRISENSRVLKPYGGNYAYYNSLDCVGGVKPAAKAGFKYSKINFTAGKINK